MSRPAGLVHANAQAGRGTTPRALARLSLAPIPAYQFCNQVAGKAASRGLKGGQEGTLSSGFSLFTECQ